MSELKIEVGKWYITKDGKKFYIAADARVNNPNHHPHSYLVAFLGGYTFYFDINGKCHSVQDIQLVSEVTPRHPMEDYIGKIVYVWDVFRDKGKITRRLNNISPNGYFYDDYGVSWACAEPLTPEDITRNN